MEISSYLSTCLSSHTFHKPPISSTKSSSLFVNHTTAGFLRSVNKVGRSRTRFASPDRKKGLCCNSLFGLGVPELAVIAGVAALLFGPKQIPEIGRSIGKTFKGFQQAAKEFEAELKKPEESECTDEAIEVKPVSDTSEDKEKASVSASKESS